MCHGIILIVKFSQDYYVIIDRGFITKKHGREVVDGLNTTDKRFLFKLMANVQLSG